MSNHHLGAAKEMQELEASRGPDIEGEVGVKAAETAVREAAPGPASAAEAEGMVENMSKAAEEEAMERAAEILTGEWYDRVIPVVGEMTKESIHAQNAATKSKLAMIDPSLRNDDAKKSSEMEQRVNELVALEEIKEQEEHAKEARIASMAERVDDRLALQASKEEVEKQAENTSPAAIERRKIIESARKSGIEVVATDRKFEEEHTEKIELNNTHLKKLYALSEKDRTDLQKKEIVALERINEIHKKNIEKHREELKLAHLQKQAEQLKLDIGAMDGEGLAKKEKELEEVLAAIDLSKEAIAKLDAEIEENNQVVKKMDLSASDIIVLKGTAESAFNSVEESKKSAETSKKGPDTIDKILAAAVGGKAG